RGRVACARTRLRNPWSARTWRALTAPALFRARFLQLVGDRLIEILRRENALELHTVDEQRRRRSNAKLVAEADVAFDEFERGGRFRVEVRNLTDVARGLSNDRRRERRLIREEPLLHRIHSIVLLCEADGHGSLTRGRMRTAARNVHVAL